ncbi:hypothetical protein BC829DRAFT_403389 [Chytridium lagenaria]|nr:hypothetical protein BC829DRAFT_403389 [Chytridium lagenaria]
MSAPSISAMEVDAQASPQSTLEMIGGGILSRQRRQREVEDDGDSPNKRRRQGSEIQDASGSANTESYMEDVVVEAISLVVVNDPPANEPLETVVPPPAFIENDSDDSGERPSRLQVKEAHLETNDLKLRDRAVAGAKHTYRTAIQTRSKTRSSPYAR